MKKLQAEYKNNASSSEFLTKKGELLERELSQQKEKVSVLREALKNAAKQHGESAKVTQDWKIKLNNAEAAQYDLEHAIEENNQALKDQNGKMVSLGDAADKLASKLGFKIPEGAKKTLDSMGKMSVGSVAAVGAITAAVTVTTEAIKKLSDMTLDAASRADDLLTRSMKSGIDTTRLQQIDYAKRFMDFGDVEGSLAKLVSTMAKARDGSPQLAAAFQALGVSVTDTDGTLRDNWATFLDVIDALGAVTDETERDALAQEILGKGYAELKPLIIAGTDTLQAFMDKAIEAGVVMDIAQVQKLGEVDDKYQELQATIEGLENELAAEFAPAVIESMETFKDMVTTAGRALVDSGLIDGLGDIVIGISGILDAGTGLIQTLPSWMNPIESLTTQLRGLTMVAAMVADAMTIAGGLLPWNWGSGMVSRGLGVGAENNVQKLLNHNRDTSGPLLNAYNAGGNQNWRGGLTWVGESGPELVALPRGSRIYSNQESRDVGSVYIDNITIDAHNVEDFNYVVNLVKSQRIRSRMR